MEAAKALDPVQQEGYVVVDAAWNRIKLKSPQYVALAHLRDSKCSPARLLEVIQTNESSEFLTYFPEWKPLYEKILGKFNGLAAELDAQYVVLKDIPVQKDFALLAVKSKCSAALFQIRSGKVKSAEAYLRQMTFKNLALLLGIKEPPEEARVERGSGLDLD
jgi:hypothetical protein